MGNRGEEEGEIPSDSFGAKEVDSVQSICFQIKYSR